MLILKHLAPIGDLGEFIERRKWQKEGVEFKKLNLKFWN